MAACLAGEPAPPAVAAAWLAHSGGPSEAVALAARADHSAVEAAVPQVGLVDVWPASLPGRHDRAPWAGRPVPSGSGRVEPVAVRLGSPAGAERSAKVSAAEEAQ